jgi:hypothetical protein
MNAVVSCAEESQLDHAMLGREVAAVLEGGGALMCGRARTLAQVLASLRDLRDARGVRHELPAMMSMAVLAVLCGQRAWSAMAAVVSRWDEELLDALGVRRHPGHGDQVTPSASAFTRLHLAVDMNELVSVLSAWLAAWALEPGTTAAIVAMRTRTTPRLDPAQVTFAPQSAPAAPAGPGDVGEVDDVDGPAEAPEVAAELSHLVLSGATRTVLADDLLRQDELGAICAAPGHPCIDPGLLIRPGYLPRRTAVAVDGKEDRGAKAAGAPKAFVLRAVTHHAGILVGSRRIPDKTGEATNFQQLLEPLPLAGVLVTADAAQANRANATWITGVKNGHYLMPVEHASHCSCCSSWCVKQSSLAVFGLDTESFAASSGEVDGVELAALDLVQHGLAGDAEVAGGLAEGQPAVGCLGPDPVAELLVDADLPGCSRGELLAGDEAVA